MPDIYLYAGEASPNDIRLSDPTVLRSGTFDTATISAIWQLSNSYRNVRNCSLYGLDQAVSLHGFFDFSVVPWKILDERMAAGIRYLRDQPPDVSWIFPTLPALFDPTTVSWALPSDRMGARLSGRADTNLDLSWLTALGSYDPAIAAWTIDSQFVARTKYWTAPWTSIDWCTATLPAAPFDETLFPGIAELVGWRTATSPSLNVAMQWALYDLSWLHDVIPLTDPVPGTFVHIRPIAPIMNRRRHRRRR